VVTWMVTNKNGKKMFKYETEVRTMQKNINGGVKEDEVALLTMSNMNEFIPWEEDEELS
jgi:hypothetical protein